MGISATLPFGLAASRLEDEGSDCARKEQVASATSSIENSVQIMDSSAARNPPSTRGTKEKAKRGQVSARVFMLAAIVPDRG